MDRSPPIRTTSGALCPARFIWIDPLQPSNPRLLLLSSSLDLWIDPTASPPIPASSMPSRETLPTSSRNPSLRPLPPRWPTPPWRPAAGCPWRRGSMPSEPRSATASAWRPLIAWLRPWRRDGSVGPGGIGGGEPVPEKPRDPRCRGHHRGGAKHHRCRWGPTRRTSRCGGPVHRSSSSRPSPSHSSSPRWRRGTSRVPAPTSPSSSAASASPSNLPRWTTSPRQAAAPQPPSPPPLPALLFGMLLRCACTVCGKISGDSFPGH